MTFPLPGHRYETLEVGDRVAREQEGKKLPVLGTVREIEHPRNGETVFNVMWDDANDNPDYLSCGWLRHALRKILRRPDDLP